MNDLDSPEYVQSIQNTIDLTLSQNAELTLGLLWEMVKMNVAGEIIKFSKQKAKGKKIKQLSFYWSKSKKEKINCHTCLTTVNSHFWKNK